MPHNISRDIHPNCSSSQIRSDLCQAAAALAQRWCLKEQCHRSCRVLELPTRASAHPRRKFRGRRFPTIMSFCSLSWSLEFCMHRKLAAAGSWYYHFQTPLLIYSLQHDSHDLASTSAQVFPPISEPATHCHVAQVRSPDLFKLVPEPWYMR